eukprot:1369031-Amorphochlora_amoeboformis.AAC.1
MGLVKDITCINPTTSLLELGLAMLTGTSVKTPATTGKPVPAAEERVRGKENGCEEKYKRKGEKEGKREEKRRTKWAGELELARIECSSRHVADCYSTSHKGKAYMLRGKFGYVRVRVRVRIWVGIRFGVGIKIG